MWKSDYTDNDKQLDVMYLKLINGDSISFPYCCPICSHRSAHIYLYQHSIRSAGLWLWCSQCRYYSHSSIGQLPGWWINVPNIDLSDLTAEPNILEINKNMIDDHINTLVLSEDHQRLNQMTLD